VKVEKIPFSSTTSAADSAQAKQTKENCHHSVETSEAAASIDDAGHTGSGVLPPSLSSSPSPQSKKLSQTENVLHLTTAVQDTVQSGAAKIQKEGSSTFVGERDTVERIERPAPAGEKSPRISSALNCEVEDSRAKAVTDVKPGSGEPQANSAPAAPTERKSHDDVESAAESGRLEGHGRSRPKLVHIRCPTDAPDQNCKTQ